MTLLEHVDVVGIDNLADVVRDDDDGAARLDGIDARLDLFGGDGVETGGGLVEEDDGRVLEKHTGDGDALLLSATELQRLCLETVGQLHDLVVDIRLLGSLHHVVVGGVGVAVFDVLLDGAVEDMVLLQHQSHVLAQPLRVPLTQFHPVEGDAAAVGMVELVEQVDDGALSRPAEADEGGDLAALDMHGDIEERLCAVAVGEVDARELEVALHLRRTVLACGLHLVVGMQDTEESLGVDERVVHVVVDAVELPDGRADVGEEHHMVHDFSDGHAGIVDEHEIGGEDDDEHGADLLEKTLQTVEHITLLAGVELQVGHRALDVGLASRLYLFAVERLDDGDALDDVEDALAHRLMAAEDAAPPAFHPIGLDIGDPEVDGDDAERHESDVDVGHEHQHEGEDGTGEERQDFDEEVVDGVAEAHDATVDTRLQFARLVALGGEERHPERQHAFHHAHRQVAAHEDAHTLAVVALEEGHQGGDDFFAQEDDGDGGEDAHGTAPGELRLLDEGVDGIDGTVEHHGIDLGHE